MHLHESRIILSKIGQNHTLPNKAHAYNQLTLKNLSYVKLLIRLLSKLVILIFWAGRKFRKTGVYIWYMRILRKVITNPQGKSTKFRKKSIIHLTYLRSGLLF